MSTTHGHTKAGISPTYHSWQAMKKRCLDQNHWKYRSYGARGIKICDRWCDDFGAFLSDMGERPKGSTLHRIDNDGDYCPSNCEWATAHKQVNSRPYSAHPWAQRYREKHPERILELRALGTEETLPSDV